MSSDEIVASVVSDIVAACAKRGRSVSETLAAFVARTVILDERSKFQLDRELSEQGLDSLVDACVKRLGDADSPSLETIKMQVAFDTAYVQNETQMQNERGQHVAKITALKNSIAQRDLAGGNEYEGINNMYRRVYQYLIVSGKAENAKDKTVEREIAAALESVFPKIGLRSFVALERSEKLKQLDELASIVWGIRIFNRDMQKGGAGLSSVPEEVYSQLAQAIPLLRSSADEVAELCTTYSDVITNLHRKKPKDVPSDAVMRLQEELANRRQYVSYVNSLHESATEAFGRVDALKRKLESELSHLKTLVGSRTSVPKEKVYPMFDSVADTWKSLEAEQSNVETIALLSDTLDIFKSSCTFTLSANLVDRFGTAVKTSPDLDDEEDFLCHPEEKDAEEGKEGDDDPDEAKLSEEKGGEGKEAGEEAVLLTLEDTPDYLQLDLEYQGFCPWTIVHRAGLLLPGDVAHGIVRYQNAYHVFASKRGVESFMEKPAVYVNGVLRRARRAPELIHLIQLQKHFPQASIDRLLSSASRHDPAYLAEDMPTMTDASTETPIHFVEKRLDPSYDWNEWSLRRKALQIANLRKAKTVSSQTTQSHLRRENETQVYLPRDKGTMTGINKGTNPPIHHRYISGLRGGKSSKYIPGGAKKNQTSVVNLTLEL